ncbi:hypothetical protein TWF481_010992 [Arthrobotrys musiformis]|uniref:Uncharacterized protein n=1 Tax=Arthrobotrys musiformis TaxID=47236 RepID=A0AAV9VX07_9PEZI
MLPDPCKIWEPELGSNYEQLFNFEAQALQDGNNSAEATRELLRDLDYSYNHSIGRHYSESVGQQPNPLCVQSGISTPAIIPYHNQNHPSGREAQEYLWRGGLDLTLAGEAISDVNHYQLIERKDNQPDINGYINDASATVTKSADAPFRQNSENMLYVQRPLMDDPTRSFPVMDLGSGLICTGSPGTYYASIAADQVNQLGSQLACHECGVAQLSPGGVCGYCRSYLWMKLVNLEIVALLETLRQWSPIPPRLVMASSILGPPL